ncbi:MAG: lamin tail domain-containing protein [Chloroflexota bacterium]|nr:lamin tail domain-containing protein [Chloroflexota bacterium]MDP6507698.1 lamin tail domain-containing protein [Chloroflexota bacterium]MDP6758501.1 lamin tail domain-containing protein [Chloroflexota bacterium]
MDAGGAAGAGTGGLRRGGGGATSAGAGGGGRHGAPGGGRGHYRGGYRRHGGATALYRDRHARDRNEAVLGDGIVRLVPDEEDRDIYGRLLRYVYVGETFVNLELAERGVAVVMRIAPNTRHADEFKEAVAAAEKAGVGCLWDAESLAAEAAARAAATRTPVPTERIMVTNLHANAAGRDQENLNDEYVTIVNLGPYLEIGGWSLSNEADHRYTFADFTWATGVELRLHTGSGTDGDGAFYWGASSPIWNNTGDTLRLEDATGTQVLVYSYTD